MNPEEAEERIAAANKRTKEVLDMAERMNEGWAKTCAENNDAWLEKSKKLIDQHAAVVSFWQLISGALVAVLILVLLFWRR